MFIDCLSVHCVACAALYIEFWRHAYDDGQPCKVSSASLATDCELTIDVKALLQPFMFSTLGVTSYEIYDLFEWLDEDVPDGFEALWSAWHRDTVQLLEIHLTCPQMFPWLVARMLAEPGHAGRHYFLSAADEQLQAAVESYVEVSLHFCLRFESLDKLLCFSTYPHGQAFGVTLTLTRVR